MANTGHMDDDHSSLFPQRDSTLRLRDGADEAPDDAEARMRAALGLFGTRSGGGGERHHNDGHGGGDRRSGGGGGSGGCAAAARRHRFVQDGEVPVSVVRGRPGARAASDDRTAEELAHEKQARAEIERRLADKEVQLRTLQTRIGHAELERDNALAEAREWRDKAQAALDEVRQVAAAADPDGERARAARKAQPRPENGQLDLVDPEPVKWWL